MERTPIHTFPRTCHQEVHGPLASVQLSCEHFKLPGRVWENRQASENQACQNKSLQHNVTVPLLPSFRCKNGVWDASQLSVCIVPFPRLASSADLSSSSMGINTYCHMTQMRLGMELNCIGWGSTLAVNRFITNRYHLELMGWPNWVFFSKQSSIWHATCDFFLDTGGDRYCCYVKRLGTYWLDYCVLF